MATPGRQRSTNFRHCPSDCGWAYSTFTSDIATPGRVTRYWRMGMTVSPAICSAVSWMSRSRVKLTLPSSRFSMGRRPTVAASVSMAVTTAGMLASGR